MKAYINIIQVLIAIFLSIASQAKQVSGFAFFLACNNNSKESLVSELENVDIVKFILGESSIKINAFNLSILEEKLSISQKPSKNLVEFRFELTKKSGDVDNSVIQYYELYVRLRLNGVSSFTSLRFLRYWFVQSSDDFTGFDGLPLHYCSEIKQDRIPKLIKIFLGDKYFEVEEKVQFYTYLDQDICWILRRHKNRCIFISGADGKHFNVSGFDDALNSVLGSKSPNSYSDRNMNSLAEEFQRKFFENIILPHLVPLPNTF